jgi:putative salt-induced outer membrane protein YdiY
MTILCILLLCLFSVSALADEVRLKNGDRITGEIQDVQGGHLVLRSDYAGQLSIDLDKVDSVSIVDAGGEPHEIGPLDLPSLNVKAYRDASAVDYTGHVFGSATDERGNTTSERLFLRADLMARARKYRYELSGRVERRAEPPAETTTAWLADGNYDRFLDERHFVYVRGSLEHDPRKDLELRRTVGAGYGRQVLERRTVSLSVRGGLDHVSEDRLAGDDRRYPALGWGIKARYAPRPQLELFHEQEGFWNLDETQDVVLRTQSGLRVPVADRLKASVQLKLDWERRPSPGRHATDRTLLFGLDYDF